MKRRHAARWLAGWQRNLPDEEKIKASDYVIDNSGSLDDTQKQVREIYTQLKEQA